MCGIGADILNYASELSGISFGKCIVCQCSRSAMGSDGLMDARAHS